MVSGGPEDRFAVITNGPETVSCFRAVCYSNLYMEDQLKDFTWEAGWPEPGKQSNR